MFPMGISMREGRPSKHFVLFYIVIDREELDGSPVLPILLDPLFNP